MKRLSTYALCLLIAVLPGCMLSEQQRSAAAQAVEQEYLAGRLTAKQRDAALEGLEGVGVNWDAVMQGGVNVLLAVLLGTPIASAAATRRVMKIRGPVATAEERVRRAAAPKVA